jgi:hypothetical protein
VRAWLLSVIITVASVTPSCIAQTDGRPGAIERALVFVYTTASDKAVFTEHGDDLLWCFFSIANTAKDSELRKQAAKMGRELALKWRASHPHVPANANADVITHLVMGAYAVDRLGVKNRQIKAELRKAAARFTARDYLGFDPRTEPPDHDGPNRYNMWMDALICTFFGDAYGVELGARYRDVVKWLPHLRPYVENDESLEFDEFYAITHLIYTLDRYGERRVSPSFLLEEVKFLKRTMSKAMVDDDPEMVGEAMDCLKALGFENDPLVLQGQQYLLSNQRPDGTWAGDQDDMYTAYHSAWTSIDALRDYRFRGKVRKVPAAGLGRANSATQEGHLIETKEK